MVVSERYQCPRGNAANGTTLYSGKCAGCHGPTRGGNIGPALDGATMNSKFPDFDSLKGEVSRMSTYGASTTDSEAEDITAFLYSN